tara:strand:- start:2584 stop:2997 length:414 start_codon:yes stop_codon:yes gene_type:complete
MDLNKAMIVGRLTKKPELANTNNGTQVTKFSIANNRYAGQGKEEEVNYFDVVVWGKRAEVCVKFLDKGSQVAIDARLEQQRWQDKEGNNRSKVVIVADNIQFIGGKKDNQSQSNGNFDNIDFGGTQAPNNTDDSIPF